MRYIISYVSTASPSISNSDIEKLAAYVGHYNNTIGIGGILICSDRNFFQILEGKEDTVKNMFERIKKDTRHHNIIKMLDQKMNNTSFSEYHSPFTVISDKEDQSKLQQFLKKKETSNPEHYKSISYLAQKFIKIT
ncbi:BLUF domain-containing protein [Aquimarina aquimarini]|uniref:BLUF domain-containing protein n=1 Tax=Aquimarina aquimarini TaxID=1191734 RepID=UPI000D554C28|nr:BLUF domain-containing protein [Aquimarina aquimarini]